MPKQRLPSKIEVRRLNPGISPVEAPMVDSNPSWLVADRRGMWRVPDNLEHHGYFALGQPVESERLADHFTYLWERSVSDPELRVLRL